MCLKRKGGGSEMGEGAFTSCTQKRRKKMRVREECDHCVCMRVCVEDLWHTSRREREGVG